MKEEIFDFDKHKGRRIKALIGCPLGGNVKKGEIGVLKYDNVADFPSQSGYSCGGGDNFYKNFELLPEDAVKEPQFEVGKWYKFDWVGFYKKVILKIDGVSPTSVLTHNRVFVNTNDTNINAHDDEYFVKDMQNIELLTDLSEIQQYLPNNHPDKIKKELAVSDLVEDEIYHITYNKGVEFIILSAGKSEIKKYIRVRLRDFHNTGNCYGCKKIRPATPEEKKWLKVCIKQDKFIEQSALDLYDDEGNIKVIEQEPMKTAVHVKTSEEFDFVISKIREKSDRYNSWNVYRTESCISSDSGDYQNKDWFSKNNYKVVSFEDWCEDNEYIFVTQELKEEELKVGDYAVVLKGYSGSNFTPGNIVKLVLDEKDGFQCLYVRTPYSKNTPFIYTKNLRKATTQEILAETLPTVIGHIKNPFEITNAQENINILPKPKELEIVPISKYFKIRN